MELDQFHGSPDCARSVVVVGDFGLLLFVLRIAASRGQGTTDQQLHFILAEVEIVQCDRHKTLALQADWAGFDFVGCWF